MVRAGTGGRFATVFRQNSYVSIGWRKLGDLTEVKSREELLDMVAKTYPETRDQTRLMWAGQLYRFVRVFQIGDRVVTYDPGARIFLCGTITGDYVYDGTAEFEEAMNRRAVSWSHERKKDSLSALAQNSLGAISTIFKVSDATVAELWNEGHVAEVAPAKAVAAGEQDTVSLSALSFEQLSTAAQEAISDKIANLDPYQMQELVAGLLRAMGYKTVISKPGADRGRDIIASPDGFGFQDPRIVVEVKHRPGERMGAPELRSFLGGRHPADKGLYVSTGGFTNEARYEAERANIPLTLIDFDGLIAAIVDNYDRFDEQSRQLLGLRAVYWPAVR
jgi:restriction system protein